MATPDDHWFGWLADALDADGVSTAIPRLPDSSAPDAARWHDEVASVVGAPDGETIIVAHSLGALAVLRYLASLGGAWRMRALAIVSGFLDPLPALPELDDFIGEGCDISALASHIEDVIVFRSDDDPLVPVGHTDRLAALLGVEPRIVRGAGHFLAADGVSELAAVAEALGVTVPRASSRRSPQRAMGTTY